MNCLCRPSRTISVRIVLLDETDFLHEIKVKFTRPPPPTRLYAVPHNIRLWPTRSCTHSFLRGGGKFTSSLPCASWHSPNPKTHSHSRVRTRVHARLRAHAAACTVNCICTFSLGRTLHVRNDDASTPIKFAAHTSYCTEFAWNGIIYAIERIPRERESRSRKMEEFCIGWKTYAYAFYTLLRWRDEKSRALTQYARRSTAVLRATCMPCT